MSVFENLLVGAAFGARRRERECYDHCVEVLDLTGLLSKANLPAGTLTLLQRKRLELARALAVRPRLLLLDEIAGGLTEHECRELLDTIRSINARGTAIIWVEHIVHTLVSFVSRLLVLNFGRKLDDGAPAAVLANPTVQEIYLGMPAS
jgi:branched-chain amino acid transport system ATP-binding protein